MTIKHCDGCDNERTGVMSYHVTRPDGSRALACYCAYCAGLARVNWNGETAHLEPAGRSVVEAAEAEDSFMLRTLDGKHQLWMPGCAGLERTLEIARARTWRSRVGERVHVLRVLKGSRVGCMYLEEVDEITL